MSNTIVDTSRIAVSDDKGNTVYVRPKFTFGIRSKLNMTPREDRLLRMYQLNILDWRGPLFQGIECTPDNIENLDISNPDVNHIMELVGAKLDELNPQPAVPKDSSSPLMAGSMNTTGAGSGESETESSRGNGATTAQPSPMS